MQLFVNARFLTQPLTGVQRYGIEISRQIKEINPETIFLSPPNIIHKDIAEELNVRIIGKSTGHIWEQIELPFFLRNKTIPLFNPGNTAPLYCDKNYITIHDLSFLLFPELNSKVFSSFYQFLIPKIATKAKHIFTVSNTVKNELQKHFAISGEKITLTYNGISKDWLSKKTRVEKEKIIFSVGSFSKRKNQRMLINAFLESNLSADYKLIIAGKKDAIFKEEHFEIINENILILENLSDEAIINYYQKAEIAVCVSIYEGFGLPILEGLYFECKTICSDIPVFRELYDKYVYFCNPVSEVSIKETLERAAMSLDFSFSADDLLNRYNYSTSAKKILEQIALVSGDR